MSSATDYVGRTVDLGLYQGVPGVGSAAVLDPSVFDGDGTVVTGIQKLAQRWVLEFLTPIGSLLYLPTRGTPFSLQLQQGILQNNLVATQAFNLSAALVAANLAADTLDTDPPDEVLDVAVLQNLEIGAGSLTLSVLIKSLAGTTRSVIMPLNVVP